MLINTCKYIPHVKHGNGKIDRTPTPQGLRKIKAITLEAFLRLKELVKCFKVYGSFTPRRKRKKPTITLKEPKIVMQNNAHGYEPSKISNAYDSPLWQWRRVNQWHRYINDPYENIIKGHIITE